MMQFYGGNPLPQATMNGRGEEQVPGWALGLRKLYGAVAQEPVPSDFADLLARLEARSAGGPVH